MRDQRVRAEPRRKLSAMAARCIAYTESGNICRKPATILDPVRGGMVCERHRRQGQKGGAR